jgi:hypothetical protein
MNVNLFDRLSLSLPGVWIEMPDRDLAFTIERLLRMAVDQFNEAVLAYELFIPLHTQRFSAGNNGNNSERDHKNSQLISMYARSFVCSIDATRSFLFVLKRQEGLPASTSETCAKFEQSFGYVRDIRNSIQHIEERALGLGARDKPLDVKILVLGAFIDNRFGITTDEGHYAEIEVSEDTLRRMRAALEKVIWSVKWLGPESTLIPSPDLGGAQT